MIHYFHIMAILDAFLLTTSSMLKFKLHSPLSKHLFCVFLILLNIKKEKEKNVILSVLIAFKTPWQGKLRQSECKGELCSEEKLFLHHINITIALCNELIWDNYVKNFGQLVKFDAMIQSTWVLDENIKVWKNLPSKKL